MQIFPKDINTKHEFMNSCFQNIECETILMNIVLLQKQSPNEWTPFSWEEYKSFCTHRVYDSEKGVLDAMVNGGKPVSNTSAFLSSGWLSFENGQYSFTPKMIDMLSEKYLLKPKKSPTPYINRGNQKKI